MLELIPVVDLNNFLKCCYSPRDYPPQLIYRYAIITKYTLIKCSTILFSDVMWMSCFYLGNIISNLGQEFCSIPASDGAICGFIFNIIHIPVVIIRTTPNHIRSLSHRELIVMDCWSSLIKGSQEIR